MKHKGKRVLAFLLSILMLFSCLPMSVFATDSDAHDHDSDVQIISDTEHTHSLVSVEAKDANCTENGNTAYWYCDCGKYFSDAEGSTEIAADSWVIVAEHSWGEGVVTTEPTETATGVKTYTCTVEACGATKTEDIPMLNHTHKLTAVEAKAASCTEAGNIAFYFCECGKYFSDQDALSEISRESVLVAAAHSLTSVQAKAASCTEAGNSAYWYCDCGAYFSDAEGTTAVEANSWLIPAAHATVMDESVGYWVCTGCGQYFEDEAASKLFDPTQTVEECAHSVTKVDAVEATCTSDGNIAYWLCAECGMKFSDEGITELITSEIIPALTGYTWNFSQKSTKSTNNEIELTLLYSRISGASMESLLADGTLNSLKGLTTLSLSQPVTLPSTENWIMEVTVKGDGTNALGVFFTTSADMDLGPYIRIMKSGDLVLGEKGNKSYYKVSYSDYNGSALASDTFDVKEYHTYQLRHVNGVYSYWLDGEKVGDLTIWENAAGRSGSDDTATKVETIDLGDLEINAVGGGTAETGKNSTTQAIRSEVQSMGIYIDHKWDEGETTQPGCETDGKTVYKCTTDDCSAEKEIILEATGHSWDEGTVTKEPTYTETGIKQYKCACGKTEEVELPALCTHENMEAIAAKDSTCKVPGNTAYWHCTSGCDQYFADEAAKTVIEEKDWVLPLADHTHAVTSETAPTCNTTGVKVETCPGCGDVKTTYIPATTGYFWDFSQGSAASTNSGNTLSIVKSAISGATMDSLITGGTLNTLAGKTTLTLSEPVTLGASDSWIMEVTAKGDGTNAINVVFSTGTVANSATFVRIMATGDLVLGKSTPASGENGGFGAGKLVFYKVSDDDFNNSALAGEGFTTEEYHTYQLRRDNGVFSFWLDGEKVGDLGITEAAANRTSRTEGALVYEGTPFTFGDLEIDTLGAGTTTNYALQGMQAEVKYLAVYPGHSWDNGCDTDCNNEGCNETRETSHILTHVPAVANTCQNSGNLEYWKCEQCGSLFDDANAQTATTLENVTLAQKDHSYGEPVYNWAADYSTCSVSFTCSVGNETETVDCTVSSTSTAATCTTADITVHTATAVFNETNYSDVETVTGEALGHTYGDVVFYWAEDGTTATASVTCSVCVNGTDGKVLSGDAVVVKDSFTEGDCKTLSTSTYTAKITLDKEYSDTKFFEGDYGSHNPVKTEEKAATCLAEGNNTYWTCLICDVVYADEACTEKTTVADQTLEILPHKYQNPTYNWEWIDESNCEVIASFVCEGNGTESHTTTKECTVKKESQDATCVTAGKVTYTASVEFNGTTYSDEPVEINGNALGHTYTSVFNWAEDGKSATVTLTCSVCDANSEGHTVTHDAQVTQIASTDGDCQTKGTATYRATFSLDMGDYADEKTVDVDYGFHDLKKTESKAATCAETGNNEYWICQVEGCGNVYKDEACTMLTTAADEVTEKIPHSYEPVKFVWAEDGKSATASVTCSACEDGVEGHMLSGDANVVEDAHNPGDCKTNSVTTYSATIKLDKAYSDMKSITGELGSHKLTKTSAEEDTCVTVGHIEFWTCSVCDKLFADENGTTEIPAVEYIDEVSDTVWTFANGSADSDNGNNSLSIVKSAISGATMDSLITGGTLNTLSGKTTLEMSQAVTLGASDSWILEVTAKGDGTNPINNVFSTGPVYTSANSVRIMASGDLVLGAYTTSDENGGFGAKKLVFYKVSDADFNNSELASDSFTTADYHTYQLRRDNGVFSFWLDGKKVGNLAITEAAPNRSSREEGALVYEGTPFTFGDLKIDTLGAGTAKNYALQGMQAEVKHLGIYSGHTFDDACDPDCNADGCTFTRDVMHTWDAGVVSVEPTETENGEKTFTCGSCGTTRKESINALQHKHQMAATEAKEPDCENDGNTAYWTCTGCKKYFSDAEGNTEIAENSWVIDAIGHTWDNGVVTKAPTSSEEGERLFTCACGATKVETIPVGEAVSKDVVWDFSQNSATSTDGKNTLSIAAAEDGTTDINDLISDGVLNTLSSKAALKLSESITLGASEYWTMEIVAKGNGADNIEGFFSTSSAGTSATFIRIMNSGDLMIVKRLVGASDPVFSNNTYLNYKVSNEDFNNSVLGSGNFDVTEFHTYQLRRENGVFSYWLDGVKIGDLTVTEDAASRTGTQAAGTPFTFGDLKISHVGNGTSSKPATRGLQAVVKSMAIYAGHTFTDDCDETCNDAGCTFTRTVMHVWNDGVVTAEPTVTAKGEKTYTCTLCNSTKKEEIPILEHDHQMTATEAVEAECEKGGNTAYWFCTICQQYFSDAEGNTQIQENSWVTSAKGHRWNSGEITKAPTNTEPGERTYTCTVCPATKVETISAAAEITMKYDDRLDVSELGQTGAPVITNQTVISRKVGTDTLDDAVVTYVNGKLIAVGVGHATITWGEGDDAVNYNLTVEPATISLIMVTGHSLGSGSQGSEAESIVCEEGQVYSTNEKAYSFKLCTGSSSAGTVEGKDVTGMGIGYGSSLRPSKINALNEAGSGVNGVDSGIGYRWHQLTGEKVWVLNSAKGSTNLSTWKQGGYNYRHAVALFTTAEEILYNESQAGHYIVNKLGIVNFGTGNGDQNWTAELYRESFDSMWNGFRTEMAVYDFDGDGVKDTVDCIGRVPARNVCSMNDWDNLYPYPLAFHSPKTTETLAEGRLVGYQMSVFENEGVIKACTVNRRWSTDADVQAFFQEFPVETLYGTLQNGSTHSNPTTVRGGISADGCHNTQLGYNVQGVFIAESMYQYWHGLNTVTSVTLLQENGVEEVPASIEVPMGSKYVVVPDVTPTSGKLTYTVTGDAFSYYNCMVVGEKMGSGVLTIKTADGTVLKTVNVTVVEAEEEENYENAEWYVWDFAEGKATNTSGSTLDNTLSLVASEDSSVTEIDSILSNGTLDASSKTVLKLSKPVALDSSKNWTVEIVAKGDGENSIRTILSTKNTLSGTYIYINSKGDLSVVKKCSFTADDGTSVSSGYTNYKVSDEDYYSSILASSGFDVTEYHSYQLSCNRGVLSFWVDGEKIGDLALSEQSSTRGSGKPQYTQGNGAAFAINNLTMSYIGNGSTSTAYSHGLNASVKKLSIVCGSGTLTLDVNLGAATPIDPIVIYPGYSIVLPKPDTGNYCAKFVGWATNQDMSGTVYKAGDTFTLTELNSTSLYGVWEANDTTDAIHNVVDNVCTYCGAKVHSYTAKVATEEYLCTAVTFEQPATYYYSCPCCGLSSRGTAFEAVFEYGRPGDGYYSIISETNWDIAPGIVETEMILNNDAGERRQVVHVMEVDISDPYVTVMPSYMGMNPTPGNYKLGTMSNQTAWVEENMGLNVVGAMNTSLSWYNSDYYTENPELVGEPIGTLVIDGTVYSTNTSADTCLVINYDTKDGVYRPDSMPKVELRRTTAALTGWEEQVIPCNFGFIVKDGKNTASELHENQASKSILGVKEDGTIVIMQADGRLAPYSSGLSVYEAGEIMLQLGCTYAVRCDGGGSSTYMSQRPGEELKVNNTPSDGVERTTTNGIMIITTAPSDGSFARASITAENNYYAPNSEVTFTAVGTDLAGTKVDIPKDAEWQIKESGMGTIKKGVFTSNGTTGKVTAQLVYNEKVVGECVIEIVIPEEFRFQQSVITVPFGKTIDLPLVATVNNGLNVVALNTDDIVVTTTNEALGTIKGIKFTAVKENKAPEDLTSTVTATINGISGMTAKAQLNLGKGSEVIEDFENGLDEWKLHKRNESALADFVYADSSSGYVYDGDHAAGVVMLNADQRRGAMSYTQMGLVSQKEIYIENALSVGAWVYIPDDFYNLWLRLCVYAQDDEGEYSVIVSKDFLNGGEVYTDVEESGWHYFSLDVSEYESIMISPRLIFVELISQHCSANELLQTVGSPHGLSAIYIDDISVDYSAASDDREEPIFKSVTMSMNGTEVDLVKREMVTTTSNVVNIQAVVAENELKTNATGLNAQSAKAFVDGKSVDVSYANGIMNIQNVALANGPHRVRFEISDNAGNKAAVIRVINVASGVNASTIEVVPADPSLDRLYGGSVYWMDVNANMIQTIQQVSMDIDLNAVNHWELDHMEVAEGFTATYTVAEMTNTATITITRTGENTQTGKQTLASLPIRVIYYDTDIANENYTAETFWMEYKFWPQDVAVDVDRGEITYVKNYSSSTLNTFSSLEYSIDTEFYTSGQHMDPAFKAERGTAHVHKAEKQKNVEVTCTQDGYSGRTYCKVCESIVDWGTSYSASGHNYVEKNGKQTCDNCGELLTGVVEGKTYIDGVIADGWIEDTYYYEDGVMVTGPCYMNNELYYFDENGVYDPDFVYNGFHETNEGLLMYFYNNENATGSQYINGKTYNFDKNGYGLEGDININGTICSFEDGQFVGGVTTDVVDAGIAGENIMYIIYGDGTMVLEGTGATNSYTNRGSRPFINYVKQVDNIVVGSGITRIGTSFLAMTNTTKVLFREPCVLREIGSDAFAESSELTTFIVPDSVTYIGTRTFENCSNLTQVYIPDTVKNIGSDTFKNCKELTLYVDAGSYALDYAIKNKIPYVIGTLEVKNGIYTEDGTMYYYKDGEKYNAGLILLDGNYYYVNSSCEVVTGKYKIWKTNGLMDEGYYLFDEQGRMVLDAKNGIVEENGTLYFYEAGERIYAGLIEIDASLYYVNSKGIVVTGEYTITKTNDIMDAGTYTFDETGKMIGVKNGIYNEDGAMYYYRGGERYYAGLIKIFGDYYYVNSSCKVVTGKYNIYKTNDLMEQDVYLFDKDGKMVMDAKDGFYEEGGTLYYYEAGSKTYAGLIEIDGDYYYINTQCIAVTGEYTIYKTNGLLPADRYTFDETGKMIITRNGIHTVNGEMYYFKNDVMTYAGLVQIGDYYYYVNSSCKVVTGRYNIYKTNGIMDAGYYYFDALGRMVLNPKNGIIEEDGVLYYYRDSERYYAGLIEIDGNYYYVNSDCKVVTGKYVIWKTNGLMEAKEYTFDETGKMIID